MDWADVLADPSLRDLPYKIELNEDGHIVMSPASNRHAFIQARIASFLNAELSHGEALTESSLTTSRGVKVPDVAWCSPAFLRRHGLDTPYLEAPELCVEIVSPSNTQRELDEKRMLYFEQGAQEVWLVTEEGDVSIYDADGERPTSRFGEFTFPTFDLPE